MSIHLHPGGTIDVTLRVVLTSSVVARSQSRVSSTSSHRTRASWAGRMKGMGSWWAFRRRRKVSSTIGCPFSFVSSMASPARRSPRQRVKLLLHSSSVISLPSGRNHERSLTAEP